MSRKTTTVNDRWRDARGNLLIGFTILLLIVGWGIITIQRLVETLRGPTSPTRWPRVVTNNEAGESEERVSVLVIVNGFEVDGGDISLALYRDAESFANATGSVSSRLLPAESDALTWRVDSIPLGRIAVRAYQDVNGDGQLNTDEAGKPTEPFGFSGRAQATLIKPTFQEAAVEISEANSQIPVKLQ